MTYSKLGWQRHERIELLTSWLELVISYHPSYPLIFEIWNEKVKFYRIFTWCCKFLSCEVCPLSFCRCFPDPSFTSLLGWFFHSFCYPRSSLAWLMFDLFKLFWIDEPLYNISNALFFWIWPKCSQNIVIFPWKMLIKQNLSFYHDQGDFSRKVKLNLSNN